MTLERSILESLERVSPGMLNERVLLAEVNIDSPRPIPPTEFRTALQELEMKRQVVSVPHEDRGTQYQITHLGRARLLQ